MSTNKPDATRRDFLKLAGTSVPAAAATLAVGTQAEAATADAAPGALPKTEHVKKYLESARF
jgi:hypothetical protein